MSLTFNPEKILPQYIEKLQQIKCMLFDVDGILTDGRVYFSGDEMGWNRFFNVYDGHGLKLLKRNNIHVGIISGGDSRGLDERFVQNLKLDPEFCYFGNEDKIPAYEQIKEKLKLSDSEISYMGDEEFDVPLLKRVGFSATVPDASFYIQDSCDYVTKKSSGHGAAREVIDLLLIAKGLI